MSYKYTPMRPKKTPFAQKFLRGLIALLLIGAAVLYFTNPLHADELDLTLPETPFDFEQMNKDSKLIKDWEERNQLNFFNVHPKPTKEQIRLSWLVNSLDLATTIYALETMDNVREGNFILGEQPEVAEVIALKLIVLPLVHQNSNTHQMVWFNTVVTAAVVNNLYVINRYD